MANKTLTQPCYDDLYRRNFYFSQYGDRTNYFVELDYYIHRDAFITRLGQQLDLRQKAFNGNFIFSDALILRTFDSLLADGVKFKLISETEQVLLEGEDVYKITELYGYAPTMLDDGGARVPKTYYDYAAEMVQQFGKLDPSGAATCAISGGSYDTLENQFKVILTNASDVGKFSVGDAIHLDRPYRSVGSMWYYHFYSARTNIISINPATKEIVFEATAITNATAQDGANLNPFIIGGLFGVGDWFLIKDYSQSSARNVIRNVTKLITFHAELPDPDAKETVSDGTGAETDTISQYTTPSISTWKQRITDRELYTCAETELERVETGLYKKTVRKTRCF